MEDQTQALQKMKQLAERNNNLKPVKQKMTLKDVMYTGISARDYLNPKSILSNIAQSMVTEETSPLIDQVQADVCNMLVTCRLPEITRKQVENKYLPPENCTNITPVRVKYYDLATT